MGRIIGISGRKQSGKNTSANFFHGLVLKEQNLIRDFRISYDGLLEVVSKDSDNWGILDVTRKDAEFTEYAERFIWPYIKLYSFADTLKSICMDLFDIPFNQLYGTNEEKNIPTHLKWEDMPGIISPEKWSILQGRLNPDIISYPEEFCLTVKSGYMTGRDFMQFLGTDIMRKAYGPIWINSAMKRIHREGSKIAVIADLRFPNEVQAILDSNGEVIRLTRSVDEDTHVSESSLDDFNTDKYTYIIDNASSDIEELCVNLKSIY